MGTIVNGIAIAVGSIAGLLVKKKINDKLHTTVMQALGLGIFFVGLSGALKNLLNPYAHSFLFIISLAIGSLFGEIIDIDRRLEGLGELLEKKISGNNSDIAQGFVTATLLFTVGTMAVIGSIESGVNGDNTTLYAKSLIDGISAIMLTATFGIGVSFSALSVLIYQGALTFLSTLIAPYLSDAILLEIGIIGGILISALGLNMMKITKIKVANLLPSILIPPLYFVIVNLLK